jgi:hypothetical protein
MGQRTGRRQGQGKRGQRREREIRREELGLYIDETEE